MKSSFVSRLLLLLCGCLSAPLAWGYVGELRFVPAWPRVNDRLSSPLHGLLLAAALLVVGVLVVPIASAQTFEDHFRFSPDTPKAGDEVLLQIALNECITLDLDDPYDRQLETENGTLRVTLSGVEHPLAPCLLDGGFHDVSLGVLAEGDYWVALRIGLRPPSGGGYVDPLLTYLRVSVAPQAQGTPQLIPAGSSSALAVLVTAIFLLACLGIRGQRP